MARNSKGRFQRVASSTRNVTQHDPRFFNLNRKPPIIERIATALYEIVITTGIHAAIIRVSDIIKEVQNHATLHGETLGPRTVQTIHLRLSRLGTNKYIQFLDRDLELFAVTDNFQALVQGLIASHPRILDAGDPLKVYRVKCAFFRAKFGPNLKAHVTRRQLDLENRRLIFEAEEHARLCPLSNTPAPSSVSRSTELVNNPTQNTNAGSVNVVSVENAPVESDSMDSMYVDDVPEAGPSRLAVLTPHTPARFSTLNSVGAYPTPESPARTDSAITSMISGTPSLCYSLTPSGVSSDDEEEMQVDMELQDMQGILFSQQDTPTSGPIDSAETEAMIKDLKDQIKRMEKQHQRDLEDHTRSHKDELNRHLQISETGFSEHLHDLRIRYDAEMQALRDRYEAEIKELKERVEVVEKKGLEFVTNVAQIQQWGASMFAGLGPQVQMFQSTLSENLTVVNS